jgi:hypothetical protein
VVIFKESTDNMEAKDLEKTNPEETISSGVARIQD